MERASLPASFGIAFAAFLSFVLFATLQVRAQDNSLKKRILIDASSNNFPPMNMLDKAGDLTGFGRELADAALKSVGVEVIHIHSPHWSEVLEWLKSGSADFIHDTGYTKERDVFLDYTTPIIEMPEMIFVRKDQYDITGIDSLKGKKVACVEKHISHLYLKTLPGITCYVVQTPVEGLYELISGGVDAFVYPEQIILYLAQKLRLVDRIKTTGEPLRILKWSMVVKEGNAQVLSLLNEGIDRIRKSGEYERIYHKWWGSSLFSGYSRRELFIITFIAVCISIALMSIVALVFHNYRLRSGKKKLQDEIVQREQAEDALRESEIRYRRLFENSVVGFFQSAPQGRFIRVNQAFARMLGYPSPRDLIESISDIATQYYVDSEDRQRYQQMLQEYGYVEGFEFKVYRKDGSQIWVSNSTRACFEEYGNTVLYEGVVVDVSERKLAERRIRASLREKEVLLSEIHHRVKNNMQVIASLLNLQARTNQNPEFREAFGEAKRRIQSMALVHETLYCSEDLSSVHLKEYVSKLVVTITDFQALGSSRTRVEQQVEDVTVTVEAAVPFGLVLNELISNSLRHGFEPGQPAGILVRIQQTPEGWIDLTVEDDGKGLPEGFDVRKQCGLGLTLVVGLVEEQLEGTLEVAGNGGARFRVLFPNPPAKSRIVSVAPS